MATAFADFLESTATRVRQLSVDRAKHWLTIVAAILAVLILIGIASVYLIVGLFRLNVAAFELLSADWAEVLTYGLWGGICLVAGVFTWSRRYD